MLVTSNKIGYAPALRSRGTQMQRQNIEFGKIDLSQSEINIDKTLKVVNRTLLAGIVGFFGLVAKSEIGEHIIIPKAEAAVTRQLKDTVVAKKIIENGKAIKWNRSSRFISAILDDGNAAEKKYLNQVVDSLNGGKSTPNTTFAQDIKIGTQQRAVQQKIDSLRAQEDSLSKSINKCGCFSFSK